MLSRLFRRRKRAKVFVIGLDCAEPSLLFDQYLDDLPNLRRLARTGTYGELESTIPAITVPAWTSMFSGRDPGELGFYGFRNRADYTYRSMKIANGAAVRHPRVWDMAGEADKQVILVGVPQTYPVKPVNGCLVSGFLTPSTSSEYTYPQSLKHEIADVVGDYLLDVPNFRTDDKDDLLRQIYDMTDKRFRLVKHLMCTRPWDFCAFVEIGVDRIHHGMWKYSDPRHPKHEAGNRYHSALRDYYSHIDAEIGAMLELLPENTTVVVVSDHGAKPMLGGFCFNEWLMREGYLVLGAKPDGIVPLDKCEVDWSRTRAWGSGGYYGRLFLNVRDREPEGIIAPGDYERVRDELAEKLSATTDPGGKRIGTRVFRPEEVYRQVNNIPPDLIVYFGDLSWRSIGSVGHGAIHTFENDIGPDDANHAQCGLFIANGNRAGQGRCGTRTWEGVAPTLLEALGLPVPTWMSDERL